MSRLTSSRWKSAGNSDSFDWWTYGAPLGITLTALSTLLLIALAALTGVSPSPAIWYLARAAGLTTYLLLWLAVVSGLVMSTRLKIGPIDQPLMLQLHRFLTELSLIFLVLHIVNMAFDPTVELGMIGVLVPFMSDIRQPWTDLGIVSGYLLVGIAASFGVRSTIGSRTWRQIHYLTFPLWIIAFLHGIGAGTDSGTIWASLMYLISATAVLYLTTYRILTRRKPKAKRIQNSLASEK